MTVELSRQQGAALRDIMHDINAGSAALGRHHFITGLAGGGKTTLLRELVSSLKNTGYNVHVISATAMAATLANGETTMSFFGLEFDGQHGQAFDTSYFRDAEEVAARMEAGLRRRNRLGILASPRTILAFDEVSTLHHTLLEGLDRLLRSVKTNPTVFGATPIIFCGDVLQLRGAEPSRFGRYAEKAVFPVWECDLWKQLDLRIYYLDSFLRGLVSVQERPGARGRRSRPFDGEGTDTAYLNLLADMRGMEEGAILSDSSASLVAKLQDREGDHEAGWTAVCIYRSRVDFINRKHLLSINKPSMIFMAWESSRGSCETSADSLTVKGVVELRKGCRALVNTNIPGVAHNGDFGDVVDVLNATDGVNCVPADEAQHPRVRLRLDRTGEVVWICPVMQEVRDAAGNLIYQRANLPLDVGAAVTCHKVIGATLKAIVVDFCDGEDHAGQNNAIHKKMAMKLKEPWLHGCLYTVMSRVPSSNCIYLKYVGVKQFACKIHFRPSAKAFDDHCKRHNRLHNIVEEPVATPSQHPQQSATPMHGCQAPHYESIITAMREEMRRQAEDLTKRMCEISVNVLINASQTGLLGIGGSGSTSTEEYSAIERARVESLLSMARDHHSNFIGLMTAAPREAIPEVQRMQDYAQGNLHSTMGYGPRGTDPSRESHHEGFPVYRAEPNSNNTDEPEGTSVSARGSSCSQHSPSENGSSHAEESVLQAESIPHTSENEDNAPHPCVEPEDHLLSDSSSDSSEGSCDGVSDISDEDEDLENIQNMQNVQNVQMEPKWESTAFYTERGDIEHVVAGYLERKPFWNRSKSSSEVRYRCELVCGRRVPTSLMPTGQSARPQPSWRLWPEDACKMSRILVVEAGPSDSPRCYFYGLKVVGATRQQWLSHDHPHGTSICRSCSIPPTLVDIASKRLSENPTETPASIRTLWLEERRKGALSDRDRQWLDKQSDEPDHMDLRGNVRDMISSITRRKKFGLNIDAFLREVEDLRSAIAPGLVRTVVDAILRSESGSSLEGDSALRDMENLCVPTSEPLVRTIDGTGKLAELAVSFTSPLMLSNYILASRIGLDCTFNLLAGRCTVLSVASMLPGGVSKPIMISLILSEGESSVTAGLEQLQALVRDMGLQPPLITHIMQDGSMALRAATARVYMREAAVALQCCYFHFMQCLKKKKEDMPGSVWRAIKSDFRLVALGHTHREFRILRWLLQTEWQAKNDATAKHLLEAMDAGGWLNDECFRSRWGYCFSDHLGGRTTNGLESFHRVLKDTMLRRKCTLTLLQLIWALKTADWVRISSHNKTQASSRVITEDDKRASLKCGPFAKLSRNLPTCPEWGCLPGDFRGCAEENCTGGDTCRRVSHYLGPKKHHYVFVCPDSYPSLSDNNAAVDMVSRDPRVTRRVSGAFSSLADARSLISSLHLVSYEASSEPSCGVLNGGPSCTCLDYIRAGKCMHIISLHRHLSEASDDTWQRLNARMEHTSRRDENGHLCHELPSETRYGVGCRRGEQRRAEQAQVRRRGLDEFDWPTHPTPTSESSNAQPPQTEVAGCCGGIFDTMSVRCSSRRCGSGSGWARWWHVDCAEAWARASGTAAPNTDDEKAKWYCPRCEPPKRRRVQ